MPATYVAALGIIAIIVIVSALLSAALLWKNPATMRLLSVLLQPDLPFVTDNNSANGKKDR